MKPVETAVSSDGAVHGNQKFRARGLRERIWPEKVHDAGNHDCCTQIGACSEIVNSVSTHLADTVERAQCQTSGNSARRLNYGSSRHRVSAVTVRDLRS